MGIPQIPSRKNPTVFVNNEKENENESKIKILATKFDLIWAYFGGTIICKQSKITAKLERRTNHLGSCILVKKFDLIWVNFGGTII